jgi:hypothetical protein
MRRRLLSRPTHRETIQQQGAASHGFDPHVSGIITAMSRALVVAACAVAACNFTTNGAAIDASGSGRTIDAAHLDGPRPPDAPGPRMVKLVQTAANGELPWNDNGSTITATLSQPSAAGDLIAIYVSYEGSTSLASVTDDQNDAYTIVQTVDDSGNTQKSSTAYAENVAAGVTTIVAKLAQSKCCRLIVAHELRGTDPAAPLDGFSGQHQSSSGTNPDGVSTGRMTTTGTGDYIFAVTSNSSNEGGQAITAGSSETMRIELMPTDGNPACSEDQIQGGPGDVTSTFTYAADGDALTQQMAFKP